MSHPTFDVSRFENRNGVISWRVSGCLHGIRIRKNYRTREAAAAEKAVPLPTPHHRIRHRRKSATTLSADSSAKLMAYLEQFHGGIFVPYFALCLFDGIRPCIKCSEISRLKPEGVCLDKPSCLPPLRLSTFRLLI